MACGWHYANLSLSNASSSIFFWHVYFVILVPFSLSFLFVFFFCSHWSLVDVPLIFFCPADHVRVGNHVYYWVWLRPDRLM